MKLPRRRFLHLAAGAAALSALSRVAWAQTYPTRPVRIIVPLPAGGAADIVARIMGHWLERLGQPVIVENKPGAGTNVGVQAVLNAPPDGYTLLLAGTASAINATLYEQLPFNFLRDIAPVAGLVRFPLVMEINRSVPAATVAEFIAYAKANQSKLQYGSAGVGGSNHLACVLLNTAIGIQVTHVPYRGGGQAMQDLLAGRVDYQCPSAPTAMPQIDGKAIKAIAILTKLRSPLVPNLASADEQGLADFEAGAWFAFVLPKGTPATIVQKLHDAAVATIVQKLHDAAVATMDTPGVRERLKESGNELVAPERRSPKYLQKFIASEIEKWAALVKAANIKAE